MQGVALEDSLRRRGLPRRPQPSGRRGDRAFNFPVMVRMWFLPFAIVTGNTFVLIASEQVRCRAHHGRLSSAMPICRPARQPGQRGRARGGRDLRPSRDSRGSRSSDRRRLPPCHQRATRRQARPRRSRRKNFVVIMPTAEFDRAIDATRSRSCLRGVALPAGSMLIPVGDAHREARDGWSPRRRR